MNQAFTKPRISKLRLGVVASTLLTTFGVSYADLALAQDDESLEEIVVTGSRIVRRDFESNSPITTVDQADFETQTGMNIESYLNQLPEYNPAASPTTTQGDVQITPVNSVGVASISLRGFGPNRSLVLVNGKRPTPINALMVTDVNGVPSALVERVETITGGAWRYMVLTPSAVLPTSSCATTSKVLNLTCSMVFRMPTTVTNTVCQPS